MREYLFRGKRQDNGEWAYGDLVVNRPSGACRIFVNFANVRHGDFVESGLHECSGELYLVIPETVGQYTGENDDIGNRIFEGDKDKNGNVVQFVNGCWCLNGDRELATFSFTIAGNIHDK